MKRGIVVVCSVMLLPGWGMAQGLQPLQQVPAPNFDVNAICGAFAKPGAGMNGCLAQQQQAQAQIQAMWPQLSPYDQQIAGIYGDYVDMLPTVRQLYQHELLILTLENKPLPGAATSQPASPAGSAAPGMQGPAQPPGIPTSPY